MGIVDRLLKTESRIRARIESLFGDGASRTPLEVRREILEQVESRIVVDKGRKAFPFGRVLIHLRPHDQAMKDVFQAAFLADASLEADIREMLRDSGAVIPPALEVKTDVAEPCEESAADPACAVEFAKVDETGRHKRPAAVLAVVKGTAEQDRYPVAKDRVLIGRLAELTTQDGQMARRNDIVFLDNGDDINSSIGRAHAAVFFDRERNEYRIVDEVSRYGTRIFREGRTIEVPGGNPRGVRLRSGDEIYLGRACLRFEITD